MKKVLLPILFLLSSFSFSQERSFDGIIFTSQEQINDFPLDHPNYTIIGGDVRIQGQGIKNLDSLYPIKKIYGELKILQCDSISSISGLYNLINVGSLLIQNSNSLQSLTGLEHLQYVEEQLSIVSNGALKDISALANVKKIGSVLNVRGISDIVDLSDFQSIEECGILSVSNNPDLQSLKGISGLNSLTGLVVSSNPRLKIIDGFDGIKYIKEVNISRNDSVEKISLPTLSRAFSFVIDDNNLLNDLKGLSGLKKIDKYFNIKNNYSLTSLEGFENLDTAYHITIVNNHSLLSTYPLSNVFVDGGEISIVRNENLLEIIGFNGVKNASNVRIEENPSLKVINAFTKLDKVYYNFILNKTDALISFKGFDNLSLIGGDLELKFAKSLKTSPTMNSLERIMGDMIINRFDSLVNLSGFSSLKKVEGDITIKANNRLLNLSGFNQLEMISGNFSISNNNSLLSIVDLDSLKIVSGIFIVEDCKNLKSIKSFKNFEYTGGIALMRLDSLVCIQSFPKLNTIGVLVLNDIDKLKDLTAFSNIKTFRTSLGISHCDGLKDFKGLESLQHVSRNISVYNCDSIESLEGLENISKLNGKLFVSNNARITTLKGIQNAELDHVEIKNNPLLSMCSVRSICRFIASNQIIVENNNEGCNSKEQISESCIEQGLSSANVFPISFDQPQWHVLDMELEIPNIATTQGYSYSNDYVFCGYRYSKVNFEDIKDSTYIRSNHEKAYYRNREDCSEKEYLLYDYTLNVGDTAYVSKSESH